jgi:hypothetical protein
MGAGRITFSGIRAMLIKEGIFDIFHKMSHIVSAEEFSFVVVVVVVVVVVEYLRIFLLIMNLMYNR